MTRALFRLMAFIAICCYACAAHARPVKMLFWYPGEAGSTEEAQPILDEFFAYLNTRMLPDEVSGRYENSVEGGLAAIRKERPALAIISYAAWTQHQGELGKAAVLLSTLPAPAGQKTERYVLVGRSETVPPTVAVLSSEPLNIAFVRAELFPDLPPTVQLISTAQMLSKLKEIGEGTSKSFAILTPSEARALAGLSSSWTHGVKQVAQSKPVPTARVVLFDPTYDAKKIKAILLGAGSDPKARPILEELRLKGFAE